MGKIWNWWNDKEFKDYEEYESKLPQTLLEYYGKQLENDSDNLLTYDVVPSTIHNETLSQCVAFYIKVKNKYDLRTFEIVYPFDNVYPCKFYSMLTENKYEAKNYDELKRLIELEIKNDKTVKSLSNLIRHFYDKETIKKAMEMN